MLEFYHIKNLHNTKELSHYFSLYIIEKSVFKAYKI
nr:MAG TPA: hypothetical protein [Caudoviricetes sp.]